MMNKWVQLNFCNSIFCLALFIFISVDVNAAESLAKTSSAIDTVDYFKVLLGLFFVIALFLISTFLFKRYGNGPMLGRGQLRVIDGLHLGNRERLMLVALKDKQLLLAITPGRISKLDESDIDSTMAEEPKANTFEQLLSRSSA